LYTTHFRKKTQKSVGQKKMRASAGVNWHLGWSSRNAETAKNAKSALEAYFLLDF
jgi:hypothetical protein